MNNCNYSGLASTESWGKPTCEMCNKITQTWVMLHDKGDICGNCLDGYYDNILTKFKEI